MKYISKNFILMWSIILVVNK